MTNKKKIKRKKGPILCFRLTEKALDLFDAAGIDFDPPFDREYMRAMDAIEKPERLTPRIMARRQSRMKKRRRERCITRARRSKFHKMRQSEC